MSDVVIQLVGDHDRIRQSLARNESEDVDNVYANDISLNRGSED